MLGTFGFRPKATMRARALGMAQALRAHGWSAAIGTTPWDHPAEAGRAWHEAGIPVRNTRVVHPLLWPLAVGEMISWARRERPTLVHVFKPKGFGDLAGRWLRRGLPVVIDMDDWEGDGGWNDTGLYGPLQRRVFDWQERTWPAQATALTVASRALERRARDLGAPADRVHYVPNGLPAARFAELAPDPEASAAVQAAALGPGGPAILLYTRFVEFDPALPARLIAAVRATCPGARLLIAGRSADGRPEAALDAAAARLGVGDAIIRLGWIDPAKLGAIAGACALAVHPFDDTLLNRAKCSVKLLELMATATPVVTTRVGENAEMIEDGDSGLLVPPGDEASLAAAVSRLLTDPDLRDRLGQAARARVGTHYLWDQLAGRVVAAYEQARGEVRR